MDADQLAETIQKGFQSVQFQIFRVQDEQFVERIVKLEGHIVRLEERFDRVEGHINKLELSFLKT